MTHTVPIAALYAGFLAPMLVVLSLHVVRLRRREGVALLDGGRPNLARAIRAQGNFTEYAPMGLILMALLELNNAPSLLLHPLGVLLVAGRGLAAFGIATGRTPPRVAGMAATFTVLGSGGIAVLFF